MGGGHLYYKCGQAPNCHTPFSKYVRVGDIHYIGNKLHYTCTQGKNCYLKKDTYHNTNHYHPWDHLPSSPSYVQYTSSTSSTGSSKYILQDLHSHCQSTTKLLTATTTTAARVSPNILPLYLLCVSSTTISLHSTLLQPS